LLAAEIKMNKKDLHSKVMEEEDQKRLKILINPQFLKINYNMRLKKNNPRSKLLKDLFFKIKEKVQHRVKTNLLKNQWKERKQ